MAKALTCIAKSKKKKRGNGQRGKGKIRDLGKKCEICEKKLYGCTTKKKYCNSCAPQVERVQAYFSRREYNRKYMRKYRARKKLEKLNIAI